MEEVGVIPYISKARRTALTYDDQKIQIAGELNYLITCLLIRYIKENGLSYQSINDVVGALEGAKLEFYRRVAIPYEDMKIISNGDVYDGISK